MNFGRDGIWKETDAWVDRILNYCIAKIGSDIGEKTLQRETSLKVLEETPGVEPSEDYYRGFDDGIRTAMITVEMIRDGDL